MQTVELQQLVLHGREERNLEYVGPCNWNDPNIKAKITKTVLAMSNIPDGGAIVIGMEEEEDGYNPVGLESDSSSSFTQDDLSSSINEYADPYSEITVSRISYEKKEFIVIQVREFEQVPVICKRDGLRGLCRGVIFTRPRRKHESVKVPGQAEMREIIERAVDKGIRHLYARLETAGLAVSPAEEIHERRFDEQLGGL